MPLGQGKNSGNHSPIKRNAKSHENLQVDDRGPGRHDARLFWLLAAHAAIRLAAPDADRSDDLRQLKAVGTDSARQYQRYCFRYLHLSRAAGLRWVCGHAAGSC